jgi:hypothetical protein
MEASLPTSTVISICSKSHADVWKLTSTFLPRFVKASRYIVYVPESEMEFFRDITCEHIEIGSQEKLGIMFKSLLENQFRDGSNLRRFGWYLQQFYKIEALVRCETDLVAIWDADCVPVSEIELFNHRGQIVYVNSSHEYHKAYFENIEKLLGLKRIQDSSFVIPGFPMKKTWVQAFVEFVEARNNLPWYEAIMTTTDFDLGSGFSETETLGTWVANSYPGEWATRPGTWERFGQSRFGYARNLTPEKLLRIGTKYDLEIITFENWDVRGIKKLLTYPKRFWDWTLNHF